MLGGTCPTHTSFSHGPFNTTRLHYLWLHCHFSSAAPAGLGWGWERARTCPASTPALIFPTTKLPCLWTAPHVLLITSPTQPGLWAWLSIGTSLGQVCKAANHACA